MRRIMSSIAMLFVALVVYGAIVVMLIVRITRVFFVVCNFHGAGPQPPPPVISISGGQVNVLGGSVPLLAVIGTSAIPPLWWLAARLYDGKLHRDRARLGQCLECGHPLAGKRGRCPRCGERFERGGLPARITIPAA